MNFLEGKASKPIEERDDESALVLAAKRDIQSFTALYRRYSLPIYRYLFYRTGNTDDAEEITSQVFLTALEKIPHYQHRGHFSAWLFGIARYKVLEHFRMTRFHVLSDEVDSPAQTLEFLDNLIQGEDLERLAGLIEQLSEGEQELLRLRFAGELKFADIAYLLGKKESAVKMSLYRLLERLQRQVEVENA